MSVREVGQRSLPGTGDRDTFGPSVKIRSQHLERLAVVYVRQSTARQVLEHRESTELQYKLSRRAVELGWRQDRILVIDDDLGLSGSTAVNRIGFQRLLAEVSLDHVGLVLGIEMSRLARSCKDWHQLLELCALFGALLADQDGLYDPSDYNDRLLLGLKGTMSEAELHILRNRLEHGRRNKAERGELFFHPPIGYIRLPSGEFDKDPDEQVQSVIRLIFEKFEHLGSCRQLLRYLVQNQVVVPVRPHGGPSRGQLEWRLASYATLYCMLHNPLYAGAYSYGRTVTDPRHKVPGRPGTGRTHLPIEKWQVLRLDALPAFITWEQYLDNQQRLTQNRAGFESHGVARDGPALLSGLVACACCGWRMYTHYRDRPHLPRYQCKHNDPVLVKQRCPSLAARVVDDLVSRQVLQALAPAAVELSLKAADDCQREHERLEEHWQQRLERARYRIERAWRQYDAVEPENRLVVRELEQRWESALLEERKAQEEYARFKQQHPQKLTTADRERIHALSADITALWEAASFAERKEIIRHLVERVVVSVQGETEVVDVTIHWVGSFISRHEVIRPVGRYELLRDFDRLIARIVELRDSGCTASQIAAHLNAEGFRSPKCDQRYDAQVVQQLFCRCGLVAPHENKVSTDELKSPNEWWMEDLVRELKMPLPTLCHWCRKGWVHARKVTLAYRRWVIWADAEELRRLRKLRDYRRPGPRYSYPKELTTAKPRPDK
jgi:DNA invertase Pin-like site-specific DNA recombinase